MGIALKRAQIVGSLAAGVICAKALSANAQAVPAVRIGTAQADSYAEPFYALDGGFFRRAGLEVAMPDTGNTMVEALIGSSIDVGTFDALEIATAFSAGVDVAIFAAGGYYTSNAPTTLFCVPQPSAVKAVKDLEGQTVGVVRLASLSALAVREWMRQNGVDLDRVRMVELPFSSMNTALGRGTIAGAMLAEPFLSAARSDVRILGKPYDAIAKSFCISCYFSSRAWLSKHADVAKRFADALYDTARWANTHRDETAQILAKNSKLDLDRIRAMTRVTFATSLTSSDIQPILDIAYRLKRLAKPVNASDIIARV